MPAATIDADPFLRRIERNALIWCLAVAALTLLISRDWRLGLGVIGGGALTAISLYAIRSSVDAMLALMTPSPRAAAATVAVTGAAADSEAPGPDAAPQPDPPPPDRQRTAARAVLRLAGRYALLGLMGYVMIARLRLHPIGLLIGASSLVASAALEAVRVVLTRARVS